MATTPIEEDVSFRKSPGAICVTARGLARPWGAMELQMEPVLTLPQLRGEPIDAEPGPGPFHTESRASGLPPRRPGCVSGCVHTPVEASPGRAGPGRASPGEVHPPGGLPHGARCVWPLSSGPSPLQSTPDWNPRLFHGIHDASRLPAAERSLFPARKLRFQTPHMAPSSGALELFTSQKVTNVSI